MKEVVVEREEDSGLTNPNFIWEWMKFKFEWASIKFAKDSAHEKERRGRYRKLREEGDAGTEMDLDELRSTERELKEIELNKANLAIGRSQTNRALYGENPSRYFLNLEKMHSKNKTITQLITKERTVLTNPSDILAEEWQFYQALYSQPAPTEELRSEEALGLEVDTIPRISDIDRNKLNENYYVEELRKL